MLSDVWIGAACGDVVGDASGGVTSVVWVGLMSGMTVCRGCPDLLVCLVSGKLTSLLESSVSVMS